MNPEVVDKEYYEGLIAELRARIGELEEAIRLTRRALKEEAEHLTDSLTASQ